MTKPHIPSNEELKQSIAVAEKQLQEVRIQVAEGMADADALDKAEQELRFAKARFTGAEEARYHRRQVHNRARAAEIVEELKSIDPLIKAQKERAEKMMDLACEYELAHRELQGEIHGAYSELIGIRDHDRTKKILKELGVSVGLSSGYLFANGTSYGAIPTERFLNDLVTETRRIKRPVAQRPPRKKKEAA